MFSLLTLFHMSEAQIAFSEFGLSISFEVSSNEAY